MKEVTKLNGTEIITPAGFIFTDLKSKRKKGLLKQKQCCSLNNF